VDKDGMAASRAALVEGLHSDVVEIGCGPGAMFPYYSPDVRVIAVEPDEEFRAAAEQAAQDAVAEIRVVPGFAESLAMPDGSVDAIVCSTVLCSVDSISETLAEFKRVLKPKGSLRLLEHVKSEHWMAGPLMSLTNPLWLRINKVGCNWNRHIEEPVHGAGFQIMSVEHIKLYSTAAPATFPHLLIKAELV
jgi:ubiquinone/menaquinone biosynthesis C-methylase UbiE